MLATFGADAPAVLLDGGQGSTHRAGEVVLKPVGDDVEVAVWLAGVLHALPESEQLRVIRPVAASGGEWVVDRWCAWRWLDGVPGHDWRRSLEVSARFHELVSAVPWSPVIEAATNPWAVAQRAARPGDLGLPMQLIHADLCHNILWHDDLPPAVIDVSPWWAPVRYAHATIATDAVAWWAAGDDAVAPFLADDVGREALARAVVFRVVSGDVLFVGDPARTALEREKILGAAPLAPVVDRVRSLLPR